MERNADPLPFPPFWVETETLGRMATAPVVSLLLPAERWQQQPVTSIPPPWLRVEGQTRRSGAQSSQNDLYISYQNTLTNELIINLKHTV